MSKRSQEAALKAYPVKMTPLVYQDLIDQFGGKTEIDVNTYPRCLFQEGYEYAEKDTIERAVAWLKEHAEDYVFTCLGKEKLQSRLWDDLKQAMEEEK